MESLESYNLIDLYMRYSEVLSDLCIKINGRLTLG